MQNFLTEFMTYASGTEAPENYHVWAAIGAMSAVMQGRVYLQYGRFVVLPNTYIVLLGPPANGKTVSMNMAQKVVRQVTSVPLSAQAQTKEALCRELKEYQRKVQVHDKTIHYCPMAIFITELSHFLGPNSGHMIDFLTTIYDVDKYDAKTKNKGNDVIEAPYISLLACTTPEWISTYLKTDIITGGFTRRVIFVNETESTKQVVWPEYTKEQQAAFANCVSIAQHRAELAGEMIWTNGARKWFNDWYLARQLPNDPNVRGYFKARHIQMLKVATLVSLCESPALQLTEEHLILADTMMQRIEPAMSKVFNAVGRNELHAVGSKIVALLELNNGELPEKQVMLAMSAHATPRELYEVINNLIQTDQVVRMDVRTVANGPVRRVLLTAAKARTVKTADSAPSQPSRPPVLSTSLGSSPITDQS